MRIVLTGSGTGGHFYPLMAIAEAIRATDTPGAETELYFMGPDPYSKETLDAHNITFVRCPAGKLRLYGSIKNIFDVGKTAVGICVAFVKLLILYPDAIMSKGGYTTVPVVIAAKLLRIPIVIHESDAVAGRANILAGRFADYIGIAHAEAAQSFKADANVAHIGMPIRRSFFTEIPDPYAVLGLPKDRPVIFVTGGSLGSLRINNLMLDSLDELLPHYTLIHQTGPDHEESVKRTARQLVRSEDSAYYFIHGRMTGEQVAAAQSAAALIISRSGSGTIFEIALSGTPSILIPIPEEISRDQRANAYAYARGGAATVLEEGNLTDDILTSEIHRILSDEQLYNTMKNAAREFTNPLAADTLAETLRSIAASHS